MDVDEDVCPACEEPLGTAEPVTCPLCQKQGCSNCMGDGGDPCADCQDAASAVDG